MKDFYTIFGLFFLDPISPTMCGILSIFGLFTQYLIFIQVFVTCYLFYVLIFCSLSFIENTSLTTLFNQTYEIEQSKEKDQTHQFHPTNTYYLLLFRLVHEVFYFKLKKNIYFNLFLQNIVHNEKVESFWTVIPALILAILSVPTFTLLFASDEITTAPYLIVKVIGNQWFWNYDVNFGSFFFKKYLLYNFDSYLSSTVVFRRLLETTENLILPFNCKNLFLVTGSDVIHSWSLPAIGFKVDAIPGRLNAATIFAQSLGSYYGQCSEICGAQHGFMPIEVKVVPKFLVNIIYDLKMLSISNISVYNKQTGFCISKVNSIIVNDGESLAFKINII